VGVGVFISTIKEGKHFSVAPALGSYKGIKMTNIEIGDLVKYKKPYPPAGEQGVWLVVRVEIYERWIRYVTLKQGNSLRISVHPSHLDKISSSR
jgi:hypothetical protein|tara:strand:- start:1 stop:282 length:282 start_codon:yes stop_codon:yes gene_type:complete